MSKYIYMNLNVFGYGQQTTEGKCIPEKATNKVNDYH